MMTKLTIALSVMLLAGCSHITYTSSPDGSTTAEGWEIGSTRALSGMKFKTTREGDRILTIDEMNTDRVRGIEQINTGLQMIVEGMTKEATK